MNDHRPEPVQLAAHLAALAEAVNTGQSVPTGRLFGLPELSGNDYWVDIAGAAAITGIPPNTITSWLVRGRPRRNPFPAPTDTSTGCTGPPRRSPHGRRRTAPLKLPRARGGDRRGVGCWLAGQAGSADYRQLGNVSLAGQVMTIGPSHCSPGCLSASRGADSCGTFPRSSLAGA